MARIIFNQDETLNFAINNYSRNTNFEDNTMNSYVYLNMVPAADLMNKLQAIGLNGINAIELVTNSGDSIVEITDINGKIISIEESLNEETLNISVSIRVSE